MVTLKEGHRKASAISELEDSLIKVKLELRAANEEAKKVKSLEVALKKARASSNKYYSANYSAREHIKTIEGHKQTVLKAVLKLILDGLLVMTDEELEERYFVDIGNIRQTRNTIKNERK